MSLRRYALLGALSCGLAVVANTTLAEEVKPGTKIQASNFDQMKDRTFEGKTIGSMIPARLESLIREHNVVITLAASEPIEMDPSFIERTRENGGTTTFNSQTREMEGWTGCGAPFPYESITADDPDAGEKLIWNFYVAQVDGDVTIFPSFLYLLIDGNRGLERTQEWSWQRVKTTGRHSANKECTVNPDILNKTIITAVAPRDIAGLGTFTIRYMADRVDDTWAYLPSVRRVRQLSGGAWMDPIGGTDQLQDDINIWNARPNWYKSIKVLEKRWMLVTAPVTQPTWLRGAGNDSARYPMVDLRQPPFWNPIAKWSPREVYVVEAIAPDQHPYSKKIMYVDAEFPWIWQGESYDKAGNFWKYMYWLLRPATALDGAKQYWPAQAHVVDYKAMHGTIFLSDESWHGNPAGVDEDDITLGTMRRGSR